MGLLVGCCSEAGEACRNCHHTQSPASDLHTSITHWRPGWGWGWGGGCCHNGNHTMLTGDIFVLQSLLAGALDMPHCLPSLSSGCPCSCQSALRSARCSCSPVSDLHGRFSMAGPRWRPTGQMGRADSRAPFGRSVWTFGTRDPSFPSGALPVRLWGPGVSQNVGGLGRSRDPSLCELACPRHPTSQSPATAATSQQPVGTPAGQPRGLWASPGSARENDQSVLLSQGVADGSWSHLSFCLSVFSPLLAICCSCYLSYVYQLSSYYLFIIYLSSI